MENIIKKTLSISDITSWLFCPRKLYITKIKKIPQKLTKEMLIGKIKHASLELFSKRERDLILTIDKNYDKLDLAIFYQNFLKEASSQIIYENKKLIKDFKINEKDIINKILNDFLEDIKLRVSSIKEKLEAGFFGEDLWKNLDTIYISEVFVDSPSIGLKGRVDRIEISRKNNIILPFEIKSREGNFFHSDELQLTAYAMLLEEKYKTKISRGILEAGSIKKELPIEDKNKEEILKIADEIRNMKENLPPPMLSSFNKCRSCSFNEICSSI